MHLVEQRLNSFTHRFRRLTWQEEARLKATPGEDLRDLILAQALHDISGLRITSPAEARDLLRKLPPTLRRILFARYRGNLPEERFYTCMGLYEAPDHRSFNERVAQDAWPDAKPEDVELVREYGAAEAHEARELEQTLAAQAIAGRRK